MKRFVTIFGLLTLLAVAAFCLFGFLATFEPTTNTKRFLVFRIVYAVVGAGSLAGIGFVISKALRN